jgi:hypothetical protein
MILIININKGESQEDFYLLWDKNTFKTFAVDYEITGENFNQRYTFAELVSNMLSKRLKSV